MDEPEFFWVFLKRGPLQINQEQVGSIFSVKWGRLAEPAFGEADGSFLLFAPNDAYQGALGPFQMGLLKPYWIEYNLELARQDRFADKPSRLSAIFVFETEQEARKAGARYGWSPTELRKVRPVGENLLCNFTKHDMEWISTARGSQGYLLGPEWDILADGYWSGQACLGMVSCGRKIDSTPIWEILYDGRLEFMKH